MHIWIPRVTRISHVSAWVKPLKMVLASHKHCVVRSYPSTQRVGLTVYWAFHSHKYSERTWGQTCWCCRPAGTGLVTSAWATWPQWRLEWGAVSERHSSEAGTVKNQVLILVTNSVYAVSFSFLPSASLLPSCLHSFTHHLAPERITSRGTKSTASLS